jgi:neutral ceramidase
MASNVIYTSNLIAGSMNLTGLRKHLFFLLTISVPFLLWAVRPHPRMTKKTPDVETLQAGAARVNITPADPVPMSGYAGRPDASTGVRDSLYVTALILKTERQQLCLITADLIGFSHDFWNDFSSEVQKATGIPRESVVLVATHNHGGPVTRAYGEKAPEALVLYLDGLKKDMLEVAVTAYNRTEPARLGFGTGLNRMNINRRCRHPEGGVWLGKNPEGVCDHTLGVIRIDRMDGQPFALMVNWPCHATANGQENTRITGDWPGAAARYLRDHYGSGLEVLVTAGASGDIDPIYGPGTNFNQIDEIGLLVAEEVMRVAGAIETTAPHDLRIAQRMIMLPGKKPGTSRSPNQELHPDAEIPLRLVLARIGTVSLAGISGEVMTEIGLDVKRMLGPQTLVLTHCNGNSGYLCTDRSYEEGGYEPMASRSMPGTEARIVENIRQMAEQLP